MVPVAPENLPVPPVILPRVTGPLVKRRVPNIMPPRVDTATQPWGRWVLGFTRPLMTSKPTILPWLRFLSVSPNDRFENWACFWRTAVNFAVCVVALPLATAGTMRAPALARATAPVAAIAVYRFMRDSLSPGRSLAEAPDSSHRPAVHRGWEWFERAASAVSLMTYAPSTSAAAVMSLRTMNAARWAGP